MQARMKNPAMILPEATQQIQGLWASVQKTGLPPKTIALVHLRVSQLNGCSVCIDGGYRHAKEGGDTEQRLFAIAAWRDAPFFTDAERAALALAESVTRLGDDGVPDGVWQEAARHYDERGMAGLLLAIATVNVFNRLNVATRQVAGQVSW